MHIDSAAPHAHTSSARHMICAWGALSRDSEAAGTSLPLVIGAHSAWKMRPCTRRAANSARNVVGMLMPVVMHISPCLACPRS